VYKRPTILESPNDTSISVGDSTQFICTYSASSNRHIVITRWSVNGKLIEKNTSHYALTTEYNYKYFNPDQVKSTLIISNATIDISGRYTCWCEYNESMIYGNKKITSSPSSVSLTIISSGKYPCSGNHYSCSNHSRALFSTVNRDSGISFSTCVGCSGLYNNFCWLLFL